MRAETPWMADAHKEQANIEKFLKCMGEYQPPIPDAVIAHILAESGLSTTDQRVQRVLNIACQKFIVDVLKDCATAAQQRKKKGKASGKKAIDLQVSDLKAALDAKGIHIHRPEFIVSIPKPDHEV